MTDAATPAGAAPPGPSPIALAIALDLVTRHRLRLADSRDARLSGLGTYELAASAWTGPRAALVAFYDPPADPAQAGMDLAVRCDAARRWGQQRLQVQGAQVCDVLLVALRPVAGALMAATSPGDPVRVGAAWVDMAQGTAESLLPIPPGLPTLSELRAKVRAVREGAPVPTLAAVDLAERQAVAGGYVAPVRRAMVAQPYMTYGLIAFFVLVYILQKADVTLIRPGVTRVTAAGILGNFTPCDTDWWRYVTSAFMHDPSSVLHILFNALAMFWIGRLVEQLYGRLVLLGVFLLTAIVGALVWVGAGSAGLAEQSLSLGASGGISGLVGLLLMLGRVQGRNVPVGVAHGVRNYAIIVIGLNLLFGFSGGLGLSAGAPVNNWVHGGGLATGVVLGLLLPPVQAIGGRDLSRAEKAGVIAVAGVSAAALLFAVFIAVSGSTPLYDCT